MEDAFEHSPLLSLTGACLFFLLEETLLMLILLKEMSPILLHLAVCNTFESDFSIAAILSCISSSLLYCYTDCHGRRSSAAYLGSLTPGAFLLPIEMHQTASFAQDGAVRRESGLFLNLIKHFNKTMPTLVILESCGTRFSENRQVVWE